MLELFPLCIYCEREEFWQEPKCLLSHTKTWQNVMYMLTPYEDKLTDTLVNFIRQKCAFNKANF